MLALAFTENKSILRMLWDKPIIKSFSEEIGRELNYFGLPGPDIRDLIEWRDFLGWKTGVEYVERGRSADVEQQLRYVHVMQKNVMLNDLSSEWDLRKGSLENIILDGVDIDGNPPAFLEIGPGKAPRLRYDLHNWDFQGGLGYHNGNNESRRVDAIKRCIELQRGHSFLFFLTLNVRHTLNEEPSKYLTGQAREIISGKYQEILQWYAAQGAAQRTDRYRTKALVPLVIRQAAHFHSFDCYCYPVVYYKGPRENLLHFVFRLRPVHTMLPAFSDQSISDVIDLAMVQISNGRFTIVKEEHPYWDCQRTTETLQRLSLPPY